MFRAETVNVLPFQNRSVLGVSEVRGSDLGVAGVKAHN